MSRKAVVPAALVLVLAGCLPVIAQDWGVGASVGLVNDVENELRLDGFDTEDVQAWVDFRLEEQVLLRGTFGTMKTRGANAGLLPEGSDEALPDLEQRINYATIGVAYQFWEGDYTSAIFGGIGGYRIDPDPAPPEIENFRDPRESVFGWHAGVEADARVLKRLSLVGRLTYHSVRSEFGREFLTAAAGAVYRF